MRSGLAALLLLAGTAGSALAAPDDGVRISAVRTHLFYQRSGELSEDLIAREHHFNGWNTVIGEGDAKEPAENLLVVATLVNPGPEAYLAEKLTIRVTDEMDGEVQERVFDGLLLGEKSSLHLPMWLNDSTCLGPIKVTATFRKQAVSAPLQLMCGE